MHNEPNVVLSSILQAIQVPRKLLKAFPRLRRTRRDLMMLNLGHLEGRTSLHQSCSPDAYAEVRQASNAGEPMTKGVGHRKEGEGESIISEQSSSLASGSREVSGRKGWEIGDNERNPS